MRRHNQPKTFVWKSRAYAGAIILCLAVPLLSARDSIAAMVSTGDVTARQSYQDARQRTCSTSPTTCLINFANVPTNRRLEIRYVSCQAIMAGADAVSDAGIGTITDTLEFNLSLNAPWERTPAGYPGPVYNWSQPVQMFVPAGRRPAVYITTSGPLTAVCTISGDMLTLE